MLKRSGWEALTRSLDWELTYFSEAAAYPPVEHDKARAQRQCRRFGADSYKKG